MIVNVGFDTSEQNAKQWFRFTEEVLGLKFFPYEPWEAEVINVWAQNNETLIKSLTQDYIKNLNLLVSEGVQNSASAPTFEEAVKKMLKKSKKLQKKYIDNRARLIARDQVGKLTESFTRRRQTDAGIEMYIWATVGDERVRKTHRAMQGRLCRWDDASVYSDDGGKTWKKRLSIGGIELHPGQDIQCRCTAIPYFDDVIAMVDNEIDMKPFPEEI
jgi:SPP1 gp7 family putative phage head morphogenesis protein